MEKFTAMGLASCVQKHAVSMGCPGCVLRTIDGSELYLRRQCALPNVFHMPLTSGCSLQWSGFNALRDKSSAMLFFTPAKCIAFRERNLGCNHVQSTCARLSSTGDLVPQIVYMKNSAKVACAHKYTMTF